MRKSDLRSVLAAAWLGAAVGCGGGDVELGGVQGTVRLDGKPLPDATVKFVPEGGGRTAYGMTDAEGRYQLQYSAGSSGGLVGPTRIEVTTLDPDNPKLRPETVPSIYNTGSVLRENVLSGDNTLDFDLKSK